MAGNYHARIVGLLFLICMISYSIFRINSRVSSPLNRDFLAKSYLQFTNNTKVDASLAEANISHCSPQISLVSTPAIVSPTPAAISEMPLDYQKVPIEEPWCAEHFGPEYFQKLIDSSTSYCDSDDPKSSFNCFHTQLAFEGRIDSFCIGGPATLNAETMKFEQTCAGLRSEGYAADKKVPTYSPKRLQNSQWSQPKAERPIPNLHELTTYFLAPGPGAVMTNHVDIKPATIESSNATQSVRDWTVLVHRDPATKNFWHSLTDIFSLTLTLDVLGMAINPTTNKPFYSIEDMESTQVLIVDDYEEGPNYELWNMMAKKPVLRAIDAANLKIKSENIIVPLSGSGNPFWQGDWEVHSCDHSVLLDTFRQRVLEFYNLDQALDTSDRPITVTILHRKGSRQLRDLPTYTEKLQGLFPGVKIELIDFAERPLSEQLAVIRNTDVLAGVHGAGLTHAMFLPPESAVVEIEPPDMTFRGFRSLAKLGGHQYFSSHGQTDDAEEVSGDWHWDHVKLKEDRFLELMEIAIKSMYNKGLRNEDVV